MPDTPVETVVAADGPAYHMHTSGTTGRPKCVVYSHARYLNQLESMLETLEFPDGQVYQYISQLFHSACTGAYLTLATGGKLIMIPNFTVSDYVESLVREKVRAIGVIPLILQGILDEMDRKNYDLSQLKVINYSTCPISPDLLRRALDRLNCRFYQSYGMTLGAAVRIVRPDGSLCDAGEEGEICVRGQGMMLGYYQMPEKTADVIRDGWYFTHDVGYLDEDGYLYLRGRKDSLIISGGENIYPEEVIDVLLKMPEIAEAAVYGMPDPKWGEHVKASIVCKPGRSLTVEQVQTFCRANMPSFRMPREVEFLPELPKNATGKVLSSRR